MNFVNFLLEVSSSSGTSSGAADAASQPWYASILPFSWLIILGVVFYFFLYRPQKKQEKETKNMRNSIEIGDVITTAGGIVGIVVKIKEDMILIESGADRTKLQIQKWAVHSVLSKAGEETEEK
jgi:preprotein translocase subunit YajC